MKLHYVLVLAMVAVGVQAQRAPFLTPLKIAAPPLRKRPAVPVLRRQIVKIDVAQLHERNLTISIPLFGVTVVATRDASKFPEDASAWVGHIEKEPGSLVLLTLEDDDVAAMIIRGDLSMYQIRRLPNGSHVLEEIDNSKALPELAPAPPPQVRSRKRPHARAAVSACSTDVEPVIDLLVLYTVDASQSAGGLRGIRSQIRLAALETNVSFFLSGIKAAVRVVHTEQVADEEAASIRMDRDRLQADGDGYFDIAQDRREKYGADAVVLIVDDGDAAGIAFIMDKVSPDFEAYAFCVVRGDAATANFSFTHELGHLMGARHEWSNDCTNMKPFPANHGYVSHHPPPPFPSWRTIMATENECTRLKIDCRRILHWSDPSATFITGEKMGVGEPTPTDNHAALNYTAATVARFRCHQ